MPIALRAAATNPMTTLGAQIDTPIIAMPMPTAKASMLVAIESVTSMAPRGGIGLAAGVPLAAGFAQHLAANVAQESERDPVVPDADIGRQDVAAQPAEDRHHELEEAEMESDAERVARVTRARLSPAATDTASASMASPTAMPNTFSQLKSSLPAPTSRVGPRWSTKVERQVARHCWLVLAVKMQ